MGVEDDGWEVSENRILSKAFVIWARKEKETQRQLLNEVLS
jgi:hypothetical protein